MFVSVLYLSLHVSIFAPISVYMFLCFVSRFRRLCFHVSIYVFPSVFAPKSIYIVSRVRRLCFHVSIYMCLRLCLHLIPVCEAGPPSAKARDDG